MRWRRRRPSRGAYRKVLMAASAARAVEEVALASTVLAGIGFALYLLVYPSGIVLTEALVWSIEAMAFTGVSLALRVASSRTVFYRARYEIFRVEALAVALLSSLGIGVTLAVIARNLRGLHGGPTPLPLALYPLASAAASYALERLLDARAHNIVVRLVSVTAVAAKLRYDVFFEVAGGVGIVVSNLLHNAVVETLFLLGVGGYVVYGLSLLAWEHMLYLVGPGPRWRRLAIKEMIRREARRLGVRISRSRVEVYGTFAEAEVRIPLEPSTTLEEAHRRARELARHLVHRVPELLRVVVIPVPLQRQDRRPPGGGVGRRYHRRDRQARWGREGSEAPRG